MEIAKHIIEQWGGLGLLVVILVWYGKKSFELFRENDKARTEEFAQRDLAHKEEREKWRKQSHKQHKDIMKITKKWIELTTELKSVIKESGNHK